MTEKKMQDLIIVSGLPGAGKTTLVKRISAEFGWPIHSIGSQFKEEYKREKPPLEFDAWWKSLSIDRQREMNLKAGEVFARGKVIGDCRYASIYRDLPCLLVFVHADIDTRVKRATGSDLYKGKTAKEIKDILLRREHDELRIGKALFGTGFDYRDHKLYDLVLDSANLTIEEEFLTVKKLLGTK